MTMFGFITEGAEHSKRAPEGLAREGYFDGILDLATHELADELMTGYCRGIGPDGLMPPPDRTVPRLVVAGGLDCAGLEFTRDTVPPPSSETESSFSTISAPPSG